MRATTFAGAAVVLALAAAGCSSGRPTGPAHSPAAPTGAATPSPSPSHEACGADSIMNRVDEMLAGQTYESHFLTIDGELTLSVWLVDPQIEAASESGLAAGNWQALETGLTLSYRIVRQIPCVGHVFENVNPMIVDGLYRAWYIDIIPARALANLQDPTTAQLVQAVSRGGAGPARGRSDMPRAAAPAPSGSCTWPQARAALAGHLGPEQDNTAAYVLIGGGIAPDTRWGGAVADVAVQAQIEAHEDADTQDAVLLRRLDELARELACVSPAVDQLELFVVNGDGEMMVYARVPGMLIGPDAGPLPPGHVLLHHYPTTDEP